MSKVWRPTGGIHEVADGTINGWYEYRDNE
nr:MAG TPA: hypothetical protein [Caudoviricetes sp.]